MASLNSSVPFKPNVDYSWCDTDMKEIHFGYRWSIKKFSYLQEKSHECIKSCYFSASGDEKNKWCLHLYPRGCNQQHKDNVSLFLLYTSDSNSPGVVAAFEFFILNNKMEKTNVKKVEHFKFKMDKCREWGFRNFIDRDDLMNDRNHLLDNDELTICCEVVIVTERTITRGNHAIFVTECRVTEDLGHLLESRVFSDVVLAAQGGKLHAHRAILAARSPVFAAMFTHDMKEKQGNTVEIKDIDHAVLREMVHFIYTGKVKTSLDDKLASGLLVSADKYGLDGLKEHCEQCLAINLSPEKVVSLIPLASLHNANHLKARLIDFMKTHATNDVINCLWDDLISSHPNIVVGAFLKAKAMNKNS